MSDTPNPIQTSQDMTTNFDGWLSNQDADTQAGVNAQLKFAQNPDLEKKIISNQYAVAANIWAQGGAPDLAEINKNWGAYRGGHAELMGAQEDQDQGAWDAAKDDEGAFFDQRAKQITTRQNFGKLVGDGGGSEDGASLRDLAFKGAALGQNYGQVFSQWQPAAESSGLYNPDLLDQYHAAGGEYFNESASRLAPVLPLAQAAFKAIVSEGGSSVRSFENVTQGGTWGTDLQPEADNLYPQIAALDDKQRATFLSALRVMADAMPDAQRATFWGNFGKSAERATGSTLRGVSDYASAYWQMLKLSADFLPAGGDPVAQSDAIEQKLGEHNLASDLRRIQESDYSPVKEVLGGYVPGAVERGVYGAPGAIGFAATAAIPIVGLPSTFATMTSGAYESERFRLLDDGKSDLEASIGAATLAPIVAAPETAAQTLLGAGLVGKLPILNRTLTRIGDLARGGVTGWLARAAGHSVFDVANMKAQELMQPIVDASAAALNKDMPAVNWKNGKNGVLDGWWSKTGETFVTMLPLALIGAISNDSGRVETLTKASDLQLRAFGIKPEDVTAFRAAVEKGPSSASEAVNSMLQNRDPQSDDAKAATGELQQTEQARGAQINSAGVEAAKDAGVQSVKRDADGWAITKDDGSTVRIGSAEAAQSIVSDLQQAGTQKEAAGLVALIDNWHDNAPDDTQRETTLTGETAKSDGNAITYSRDGEVTREISDPAALEELRREAQMDAQNSGNPEINVAVNGSNSLEFGDKVADGTRQLVQRLEINQGDSPVLTFLHESAEADLRRAEATGAISTDDMQRAVAALANHFDPEMSRTPEERAFRDRIQRVAAGKADPTELRETMSELAVADAIGRRRDGSQMPAGSITAGLDQAARLATKAEDVKSVGKVRAMLRAVRQYFRGLFGTAAALKKARGAGKAVDFDALIDKITGRTEQTAHENGAAKEAAAMAGVEPLDKGGATFSLRASDEKPLKDVADEIGKSGHSRSWAELPLTDTERRQIGALAGVDLTGYKRVADASALRHIENRHGESSSDPHPITRADIEKLPEIVTAPGATDLSSDSKKNTTGVMSVKYLDGWYYYVEEVRTGQKTLALESLRKAPAQTISAEAGSYTSETILRQAEERLQRAIGDFKGRNFRLSAGSSLELLQKRIDEAMGRDPDRRRDVGLKAKENLQKLQSNWENLRYTPKGYKILPVSEQRTKAQLDKEQAFRQADFFKEYLEKSGLTGKDANESKVYKDALASQEFQRVYDGLTDNDWHEEDAAKMASQMSQQYRAKFVENVKRAKDAAREAAFEWRREQDEAQATDWSSRAQTVRGLRTLDAITSVLPPELRTKVGGVIQVAGLATEKARIAEIERRVAKISDLLETHLQKENSTALDRLMDKAEPKGGPGEKAGGKITVEGHRVFAEVGKVRSLSTDEAQAQIESVAKEIDSEMEKSSPDTDKLVDLYERQQILRAFGDFDNQSAADGDSAIRWLNSVYESGRNAWREIVAQRDVVRAERRASAISDVGGEGSTLDITKSKEAEKGQGPRGSILRFFGPGHQSWGQRLTSVFGQSDTATRYEESVHDAFHEKSKRVIERQIAQRDMLLKVFGVKRWSSAVDKLLDLQTRQEKSGVVKYEGRETGAVTLPVDKAQDILDGKADAATFGLKKEDLPALEETVNDWAANPKDRHENVSIDVVKNPGDAQEQMLSQNEAMHLTMLARQPRYREAMEKHGWTAESLEQMEGFLTPEAKRIRSWLFDQYESEYGALNKVHQRMFGIDLPKVDFYAPGYFEHSGDMSKLDTLENPGEMRGIESGFLRQRKAHLAEPSIVDALQAYTAHWMMTEHWKAFAELSQEMRSVFGNVDVRHAIEAHAGISAASDIVKWMNNFEGNGIQDARMGLMMARFVKGITRSSLAFSIGTWMKHAPNAVASLAEVPVMDFMKGMLRVGSGQAEASLGEIWKSDAIQQRLLSSYTPDLRQVMTGAKTGGDVAKFFVGTALKTGNFLDWGVARIPWVAGAFTTISAAIAHDYHFHQALEGGMDNSSARSYADRQTELTVARTSQPETIDRKSLAELERGGLGTMLTLFRSPERQQWGVAYSAIADAISGKGSKGDALRKVISTWIIAPMIMQTMVGLYRYAFTKDDAEEAWNWKRYAGAMAAGPASGIFFMGQLVDPLLKHWLGGGSASKAGSPFDDLVTRAQEEFKKAEYGTHFVSHISHLLAVAGLMGSAVTELPTETLQVVERLYDQIHGAVTPKENQIQDAKEEKRVMLHNEKQAKHK